MKKLGILIFIVFTLVLAVSMAADLTHRAHSLNYDTSKNITVSVTWAGSGAMNINSSLPAGFSFTNNNNCGLGANLSCSCNSSNLLVNCTGIVSGTTYLFVINGSTANQEYSTSQIRTTNGTVSAEPTNISLLRIKDSEIFHTLVEYGRGRGNYFFDTYNELNASGSGHTNIGCRYLPNGTDFELTYLHKILNIKQYYGLASADAKNATFECTYPNNTVVRQHLAGSISKGAVWDVNYSISTIEGSWERMGYLSQSFDASEATVGTNFTITCKDIGYVLSNVNGNTSIALSNFTLQVRKKYPFNISANANSVTIGNGTQEVLITYTITNTEIYSMDDVAIEINAPPYATFIGTRGEIWGAGTDYYRIDRPQIAGSSSFSAALIARYNTSFAPGWDSIKLSNGATAKYLTCWEANAYNPNEYVQSVTITANATLDMNTATSVTSIQAWLSAINLTTYDIQKTVNRINESVQIMNMTLFGMNATITSMNSTLYSVWNAVNTMNTTLLGMNSTITSLNATVYTRFSDVNASLTRIYNYETDMNVSLTTLLANTNVLQANITQILSSVNGLQANFTQVINEIRAVNLTVNLNNLTSLTNMVTFINTTVVGINSTLTSMNTTTYNYLTGINATTYNYLTGINATIISQFNNTQTNISSILNYLNNINVSSANYTTQFNNLQANFTTAFGNLTTLLSYSSNISTIVTNINTTIWTHFNDMNTSQTYLITQMEQMRQFDEELVFLVTDSVGLTQQAIQSYNGGDLQGSLQKLEEANVDLQQASTRLSALRDETIRVESRAPITIDYNWAWGFIIGGLIVAVFFLLRRKREDF